MIPIIHFAWQRFIPTQIQNVRVGQLYDLARKNPVQELFVFNDPTHQLSALIIPELVTSIVDELNLPFWESAADVGLLDIIRQDHIAVHMNQPASVVTRLAAKMDAQTVIVVNDDAIPVGLFMPGVVAERLPQASILGQGSVNLRGTVSTQVASRDLAAAIASIEAEMLAFHSEFLNEHAPDPYVCEGFGTPHKRTICPCDIHPAATCGKRLVGNV
jgi:hypothetical protein